LEMEGQGSTFTAQLAEIYGVNSTWLATGKGEMLGKDNESAAPSRLVPVTEVAEPQNQDLDDAIKLLALFSQATITGKSFILAAANAAEKFVGRKNNASTRE